MTIKHSKIRQEALRTYNLWLKVTSNPLKYLDSTETIWPGWYDKLTVNQIINRWKCNLRKFNYHSK